jgi:hypothetical protein
VREVAGRRLGRARGDSADRQRALISVEHLSHPLIDPCGGGDKPVVVNYEVVLFDHLLWVLENSADLRAGDDNAMRELAQLYAC